MMRNEMRKNLDCTCRSILLLIKICSFLSIETGTKDERLQPWYIAAILRPKNVVILFDISYSMKEENKIIFARTAITLVLKGLLPTDFVNVSILNCMRSLALLFIPRPQHATEIENGDFTLKMHQMCSVHTTTEEFVFEETSFREITWLS